MNKTANYTHRIYTGKERGGQEVVATHGIKIWSGGSSFWKMGGNCSAYNYDLIVNLWMATTTIYGQVTRLQSGGLITVAIQME